MTSESWNPWIQRSIKSATVMLGGRAKVDVLALSRKTYCNSSLGLVPASRPASRTRLQNLPPRRRRPGQVEATAIPCDRQMMVVRVAPWVVSARFGHYSGANYCLSQASGGGTGMVDSRSTLSFDKPSSSVDLLKSSRCCDFLARRVGVALMSEAMHPAAPHHVPAFLRLLVRRTRCFTRWRYS